MWQQGKQEAYSLEAQIKRHIGWRILICFLLLFTAVLGLTAYGISRDIMQLKEKINTNCMMIEDYVISQVLVEDREAISLKLEEMNNSKETKITWVKDGTAPNPDKVQWVFPFSWIYYYPLRSIENNHYGYFVVTGSFLSEDVFISELLIRSILLLLFALLIFILLFPLSRKIPKNLFIEPVKHLVSLLKEGVDDLEDKSCLLNMPNLPVELKEIESKILQLINQVEENASKAAFGQLATQVAHDIRSPLAALDSVLRDIPQVSEDGRYLIHKVTERIKDIANNRVLPVEWCDEVRIS
jgi:signal transduction histidine kinase